MPLRSQTCGTVEADAAEPSPSATFFVHGMTCPSPSYFLRIPASAQLDQPQMCADLCEDSKFFGTQYANEVCWPVLMFQYCSQFA